MQPDGAQAVPMRRLYRMSGPNLTQNTAINTQV